MSTALVTGGSAGIGLAVVQALLARGDEVISLDLKPSPEKRAQHIAVDLTDKSATAALAPRLGKVTTFIHNAGVIRPALLPEVKTEDLDALVNLHLSSAIVLMQAVLP